MTQPHRGRRAKTSAELAAKFGLSPRQIRNIMAEERSSYEARAQERREQIIELHRQGLRGVEIAARLDVDKGLVSKRLREAREAGRDLSRYVTEKAS